MSKLPPLPHWCESGSPFAEQMQAYATVATEPLLQRIAELEQRNSDLHEDVQRFKKHALNEKAARLELERQLVEARKQMESQKDEWLSWEAKRKALEKDAERWREWEKGNGLTVVIPTPTEENLNRKVTVIYSPNPYQTYKNALRSAIDAAIQKGQS